MQLGAIYGVQETGCRIYQTAAIAQVAIRQGLPVIAVRALGVSALRCHRLVCAAHVPQLYGLTQKPPFLSPFGGENVRLMVLGWG